MSRKVRNLTQSVEGLIGARGEDYDPRMSIVRSRSRLVLAAAASLLVLTACAQEEEPSGSSGTAPAGNDCAVDQLPLQESGRLTIGTDSPAFEPWFVDNDPTNGKGFESAVAYAVADRLGFSDDQVDWVKVRFNNSYKPGPKTSISTSTRSRSPPKREQGRGLLRRLLLRGAGRHRARGLRRPRAATLADLSPSTSSAPRPAPRASPRSAT